MNPTTVVEIQDCKRCKLADRLQGEKIVPGYGNPNCQIMIVGEAPGKTEAFVGQPFVSDAGTILNELLKQAGINREDLYLSDVCKCRPWGWKENPVDKTKYMVNLTPEPKEIRSCIQYLYAEIDAIKPKVLVTLGGTATSAIVGKVVKITERMGVPSLFSKSGAGSSSMYKTGARSYVVPTLHPSYIDRNGGVFDRQGNLTVMAQQVIENLKMAKDIASNNVLFKEHRYLIVDSREKLKKVTQAARNRKVMAFDIETEGLNFWDRVLGVGFAVDIGVSCYIPFLANEMFVDGLQDFWTGKDITREEVIAELKSLFEDPLVFKSAHNAKFDMRGLKREFGIEVKNLAWDSQCSAYLLNENTSHKLKDLKNRFIDLLGYEDIYYKETNNGSKPQQASLDVMANYNCGDTDATYRLTKEHRALFLNNAANMFLMTNLYIPLMEFITDFEFTGVAYDRDRAMTMVKEYTKKAQDLKEDIWRHASCRNWNPDSPEDLMKILFTVLGLKHKKRTKTGQASVDVDVLEDLAKEHIVPKLITEYKHFNKMRSTYMERFIKESEKDGRVHLSTNPIGTITGRMSSEGLQNIPKEIAIKSLFIAPIGYKLVQGDLSQAEVRCFAYYAQEKSLIAAFASESIDVHCVVAADVYKIPYDEFFKRYKAGDKLIADQRQSAKALVFGLLYGRGPESVAIEYKLKVEDAVAFIDQFFKKFPLCKKWIDNTIESVHKTGQVHNIFGRIRHIPAIFSSDQNLIAGAERQAVNSIIQSTASDITCLSLCKIHKHLKNNNIPARIVLTVHDSIVVETRDDYVLYISKLLKETMGAQPHPDFNVRMRADIEVFPHCWGIK